MHAPPELNQVEVAQAQFKNSFHLILMRKTETFKTGIGGQILRVMK